jgi:hypothetical protein
MTKSGLKYKKTIVLQGSDFLFLKMAEVGTNSVMYRSSFFFFLVFTSSSRMPRPLAAWMNGQRNCNGGAVSSVSKNTLVPPALMSRRLAAGIARRMFLLFYIR